MRGGSQKEDARGISKGVRGGSQRGVRGGSQKGGERGISKGGERGILYHFTIKVLHSTPLTPFIKGGTRNYL
jgi:hypothetical protein